MLLRPARNLPFHFKVIVRQNGSVLAWQITNMTIRRKHLIAITEVTVDGLGLGWRFDNDDFHHLSLVYREGVAIKAKMDFVKISVVFFVIKPVLRVIQPDRMVGWLLAMADGGSPKSIKI